jgi:DNA-binding XRE family transcriptional regulator
MTTREKANLVVAGYTFGDFGDFLELTPAEREYVELETALARAVRTSRERAGVTQAELAKRIGSSQSRIAKVETGAEGVSFDLAFKALFAVEGSMADVMKELKRAKARQASTTVGIRPK